MRTITIPLTVLVLAAPALLVGCEATAKSDLDEPRWQTTVSYDKIFAEPVKPSPVLPRSSPPSYAAYEPPVVTHFPGWFNDPLVEEGDYNDTYGWTFFDLFAVVYSPARFAANTVALPVSAVVQPPGVLVSTNLDAPTAGPFASATPGPTTKPATGTRVVDPAPETEHGESAADESGRPAEP